MNRSLRDYPLGSGQYMGLYIQDGLGVLGQQMEPYRLRAILNSMGKTDPGCSVRSAPAAEDGPLRFRLSLADFGSKVDFAF